MHAGERPTSTRPQPPRSAFASPTSHRDFSPSTLAHSHTCGASVGCSGLTSAYGVAQAGPQQKPNGAARQTHPAPSSPPATAAGLTAVAPSSHSPPPPPPPSSYPQTFFNDDLSTAPLFPPPLFRRTDSRPLPPVDLALDLDDRDRSPSASARAHGHAADERHRADRHERVSWAAYRSDGDLDDDDDEGDDYSYSSSLSSSLSYSDDYDEDADEEDSGGGADEEADDDDEDDSDERRPFPDPRLAKQQKYLRRSPDDDPGDKDAISPPTHVEHAPPPSRVLPRIDPHLQISHITAVRSAYSTPLDSPLASPSHVPTHKTSILPVPSNLPSPTYSHPSSDHYTSLPNSGVERTYVPLSAYASEVDDDGSDSDYRGRNRHPRLLWRSTFDSESLRVLDAHHHRVRGGPLPRLEIDDEGKVVLSASGVDREREHAGAGVDEVKGKVRRQRRRDAALAQAEQRRSWSHVGRRWSRAVEKCGL